MIRKKLLNSCESGCIRFKVVLFEQSGCTLEKRLDSDKVVVFGVKWLCSLKVVLFGQGGCIRQKWL